MNRILLNTGFVCLLCLAPTCAVSAEQGRAEKQGWFDGEWQKFRVYPHLDRAYRQIEQGRKAEAAVELQKLLDAFPLEAQARNMLLFLLLEEHQYDRAAEHVEILLRDNPDALPLLWAKVAVLKHQGHHAQAAGVLERMRSLADEPAELGRIALESAESHLKDGQADKAVSVLESPWAARAQGQQRAQILLQLVDLHTKNRNFDKALHVLRQWEEEGLRVDFRVVAARAAVLAQMGRLQNALDAWNAALALTTNQSERLQVLQAMGFLYAQLKQYPAAQQALKQALELKPGNEMLLAALGGVLYSMGEYAEAEAAFRGAWEASPQAVHQIAMARSMLRQGKYDEATRILQLIDDPALRPDALAALGETAERRGQLAEGASHYLEAHSAQANKDPQLLLQAAQLYAQSRMPDAALATLEILGEKPSLSSRQMRQYYSLRAEIYMSKRQFALARQDWQRVLALPDLSRADKGFLLEQLAYAAQGAKDEAGAYRAFVQALKAGRESQNLRLQLAYAAFGLKKYPEAKKHFTHILTVGAYAPVHGIAHVGLARVHFVQGRPGLAVESLHRAKPLLNTADSAVMYDYYRELAASYAAGQRPAEAAQAYAAARDIKRDPVMDCAHAVVLRQAGQHVQALALWQELEGQTLDSACETLRHGEQGRSHAALKALPEALDHYALAVEHKPTADVLREAGTLQRVQGEANNALNSHNQAQQLQPAASILVERAYDNLVLERFADAVTDMEQALNEEPNYLALYPELGYAHKRLVNNADASRWFRQAIDNAWMVPVHNAVDEKALRRSIYDYRGEVAKLENHFDATFVWSAATGKTGRIENSAIARSASGTELAWTPPVIGLRDDKVFQVVGRVMWSTPPDSVKIPVERGIQGAVGLRAKPLRDQNIVFGAEKLFKLGEDAEDNWLFRAMGSWGSEIQPFESDWFYWSIYAETDYFAAPPVRWAFSGEARAGWTWNVGSANKFFVSPHVVANGIAWTDQAFTSYREAGVGLLLRYLYNETKYEGPRSSVEFLLQYKIGETFNTPGSRTQERNTHALFSTLSFTF